MNRIVTIALASAALAASCSTSSKQLDGTATLRDESLQLPVATVTQNEPQAIASTLASGCEGPCALVYLDASPADPLEPVQKLIAAARTLEPAPRVFLLPPSGKPIEVSVHSPATCAVQVDVREAGIFGMADGEALPADSQCEQWDATACRGDDGVYDWPRIRSELGDIPEVCAHFFPGATAAEVDALHEATGRAIIAFAEPIELGEEISTEEVARSVAEQKEGIQWCYEAESGEAIQPESFRFRVLVNPDGSVGRVAIEEGVKTTPQFETCVAGVAEKLKFRRLAGGMPVVVEYPVEF